MIFHRSLKLLREPSTHKSQLYMFSYKRLSRFGPHISKPILYLTMEYGLDFNLIYLLHGPVFIHDRHTFNPDF